MKPTETHVFPDGITGPDVSFDGGDLGRLDRPRAATCSAAARASVTAPASAVTLPSSVGMAFSRSVQTGTPCAFSSRTHRPVSSPRQNTVPSGSGGVASVDAARRYTGRACQVRRSVNADWVRDWPGST